MIVYEDYCVGCPPERGCLGSCCPNRNVPIVYCDICGEEIYDDKDVDYEADVHICDECKEKEEE